ncbi:reverse transcriptase domain-containing protein [Tanacetum coccineum]
MSSHLEYAYLKGDKSCPVIISSKLTRKEKTSLLQVLEKQKGAIAWKMSDIKGITPSFCTHKILMEESFKPVIQPQRRLNPKVQDVVKDKIVRLLDSGLIYPISDSPWVSPILVVPKKGGMAVVLNDDNELIPSRTVTGWRVCIEFCKLNDVTRKDHFPLPFIDQMLERLSRNEYYCFLDGFSGYFQISIALEDQEKTTFPCPYGTFAYRRMPFGLCNAPITFQRCMTAIFHDMVEDFMEVFMDDFSVFDCKKAFNKLKERLTTAPIIISLDWNLPFELMCDASDFAIEAVLGQRIEGKFKPIYYASKTLNNAQAHYTTIEKELLAVGPKNKLKTNFPDEHLMILKTKLNDEEPWWYDELADGKLKDETLALKSKIEGSWGDATPGVLKFCKWLKSCFENFHEIEYEVLVKLQECWWKVNAHEIAPFTRMENFRRGSYANIKTKWTNNPYLDINRIFGRDYEASNISCTQENQKDNRIPEPSNCKVRRFEMMKYSFNDDEEYITIKESEYLNHSKDSLDAYQELLRLIDDGWVVTTPDDE